MASMTENQINLKTLQRVDSSIVEIIDNACQVAIYKYEKELGKWKETDVEGALFLYRRSRYPSYGFIIMNRMSTTNFIESITSEMQFQLQSPYLLYKNRSGDIIGSWFYEHNDLQRISKRIQTIILKHHPPPKRQRRASESETQDILTLLCEAHEEYLDIYLSEVNEETSQSPLLECPNWQDVMNGNFDIHLPSIKEAIQSHIEGNTEFIFKIHEAYVSSLKTYFTS
ncbi:uncharacterized protein [Parasteatoda tepidariorum]|uniref:uncharacterized protein isoform X2 n=1 Tax=Parasteatoda tepidariorum TaxID=114398 RepID=UPI0039BD26C7